MCLYTFVCLDLFFRILMISPRLSVMISEPNTILGGNKQFLVEINNS